MAVGFLFGTIECANDKVFTVYAYGTEQTPTGAAGIAGFEAHGFFDIARIVRQKNVVGIGPGAGFATAGARIVGGVFGGGADLGDGRRIQTKLGQQHHIGHASIVIAVVVAIGIYKVRVGHANDFCLPVHFGNKDLHGCGGRKIRVLRNDIAHMGRQDTGGIITAGQEHCVKQLLYGEHIAFDKTRGGRAGRQVERAYRYPVGGVYIEQRHIGGEKFRNACRVYLTVQIAFGIEKSTVFAAVHKGIGGGEIVC